MLQLRLRSLIGTLATVAVAAGLLLIATGADAREAKLGHLAPTGDPRHEALTLFADIVEEQTEGEIKVVIFPDSTLGSEREMFEQVQAGDPVDEQVRDVILAQIAAL